MDLIFTDQPNELTFNDRENQRQVVFLYREPTAEERIKYSARIAVLFRNRDPGYDPIEDISKIQFEAGLEVLSGFRASGIPINISSNPDAKEYNPGWKKLLSGRVTDLIVQLGRHAFESGGYSPQRD